MSFAGTSTGFGTRKKWTGARRFNSPAAAKSAVNGSDGSHATHGTNGGGARTQVRGDAAFWSTAQIIRDTRDGSTKTTRWRAVAGGVVLNTCTRGPAGLCEALVFIPGASAADFLSQPAATS